MADLLRFATLFKGFIHWGFVSSHKIDRSVHLVVPAELKIGKPELNITPLLA